MFDQLNVQLATLVVGPLKLIGAIVQNVVQIAINVAINVGPIS